MATVSQRTLKAKVVNTFHPGHRKVVALDGPFTLGRKLHFSVSGRTCECLVNHHGLAVSYMGHCGNAHQGGTARVWFLSVWQHSWLGDQFNQSMKKVFLPSGLQQLTVGHGLEHCGDLCDRDLASKVEIP